MESHEFSAVEENSERPTCLKPRSSRHILINLISQHLRNLLQQTLIYYLERLSQLLGYYPKPISVREFHDSRQNICYKRLTFSYLNELLI